MQMFVKIPLAWLMFVTLLQVATQATSAYECAVHADPWFTTTIQINQTTVPTGIIIEPLPSQNSPTLRFTNSTPEPLYFVQPSHFTYLNNQTNPETNPVPEGYQPLYVLTQSELLHYIASTEAGHSGGSWINPSTQVKQVDPTITETAYYNLDLTASEYIGLEPMQVYADHRPRDVTIPAAQSFNVPVFYQDTLHTITGQVRYSLNPDYNPLSLAESQAACEAGGRMWLKENSRPWYLKLWYDLLALLG